MAMAYAALSSLDSTLENIQNQKRFSISLEKMQMKSLQKTVSILIDFLESYSYGPQKKAQSMESRIAHAASSVEDIIESHVVDQITSKTETTLISIEKAVEELDLIMKEVMEIKEIWAANRDGQFGKSSGPSSSFSMISESSMVGFAEELIQIMDRLTGTKKGLLFIPIVGMGGIGKTTLAKNVYENQLIVHQFDVRAWVVISQEYSKKKILLQVLSAVIEHGGGDMIQENEDEILGEKIHKSLYGRRYLIVVDDMWTIEAWDEVNMYFPDNNNGSRIVVTTRISDVANHFDPCSHHMDFLDENKSWKLFHREVGVFPIELEKFGKQIVKSCKGLPLSIVTIGGLLAKTVKTEECWEHIANDIHSTINSQDDERCMKILYLSYHNLPIHLKPCFLYMAAFPEDKAVCVSKVVRLWIAEGFLRQINGNDMEVVGEEYMRDLISRNLLLAHEWGSSGKVKYIKIHDLLRDLCLRECQAEKFVYVPNLHNFDALQHINTQRRIGIYRSTNIDQIRHAMRSASLLRSMICDFDGHLPLYNPRLLRVLDMNKDEKFHSRAYEFYSYFLDMLNRLLNSRYIVFEVGWKGIFTNTSVNFPWDVQFHSSPYPWNLQFLIVKGADWKVSSVPYEIWEMTQLRHLDIQWLHLQNPCNGQTSLRDGTILCNLQALLGVENFMCSEEVVRRIPNVKKLAISYSCDSISRAFEEFCLENLNRLQKLESLSLSCFYDPTTGCHQNVIFPSSLKKLKLDQCGLDWEDMTKIGSLPHLEVLKLGANAFKGPTWRPIDDEFLHLKYLLIDSCYSLIDWEAEDTHFPCLENLHLRHLHNLDKIPSDIGHIATLKSINISFCSDSSMSSAMEILQEQKDYGNGSLQVRV